MKKTLLVTTALEKTWKENIPILFLGEWCKKYTRKKLWNNLIFETQKYHWNDRVKLKNDYSYSKKIYKKIIQQISNDLNNFHQISHNLRYWKIIIGPWLLSFIQIILERYENLKQIENYNEKFETISFNIKKDIMLPKSNESYSRLIMTDTWNHFIFSEIIKNSEINKKISIDEIEFEDEENFQEYLREKHYSHQRKIYSSFLNIFKNKIKNEKFLISESYLGFFDEIKLNFKLSCLPKYINFDLPKNDNPNWFERENFILKNFKPENEFEKILKNLVKIQLPISYFENFKKIRNYVEKINWPAQPDTIFTSHFLQKTTQSFYTAEKIEKNHTKLIVGQHGGVYGQYSFSTIQDYEIDVCDKFLSWGWKDKQNQKIIPFGIIKNISKIKYKKNKNKILFILRSQSRYTHRINSLSGSFQLYKYFNDCFDFCKKLNKEIQHKNLIVRLHARRFWDEGLFLKDEFPHIHIDEGYKNIHKLISNSKLVVYSYIGTGYLETLSMNFPSVIFFDTKNCSLTEETLNDLEVLSKVNIFHFNYESASRFINENYENIDDWWENDKTQEAIKFFCKKYALLRDYKLNELTKIIRNEKN